MRTIIKSLLLSPTREKWNSYHSHFRDYFAGRDKNHDAVVDFIADFTEQHGVVPAYDTLARDFYNQNDTALFDYIRDIAADPMVEHVEDHGPFIAMLNGVKNHYYTIDIQASLRDLQTSLSSSGLTERRISQALDNAVSVLYAARNRAQRRESSTSLRLYGDEATQGFREHYQEVSDKRRNGEDYYYKLPFQHYRDTFIKKGDLIFTGAFTSQGKSITLRFLTYYLITTYKLNFLFFTVEMTAEDVRRMFYVMHANNRERFPDGLDILYDTVKEAKLSPEQEAYLFNEVVPDFNDNYGKLVVEQPNKARYTLGDLQQKVAEVAVEIDIDGVAVDYLTRMNPLPHGTRGKADPDDYNRMIQDFKTWGLSYRDRHGQKAPLLLLSAAQISRHAFDEALKRDNTYDITAYSMYTEIERSADHLLTTLMTPEMQAGGQIKLQQHKNRDGRVEHQPVMLRVLLAAGQGLVEIQERSEQDMRSLLMALDD